MNILRGLVEAPVTAINGVVGAIGPILSPNSNFNPSPITGNFNPTPLGGNFNPSPLTGGFNPNPLNSNFNPNAIGGNNGAGFSTSSPRGLLNYFTGNSANPTQGFNPINGALNGGGGVLSNGFRPGGFGQQATMFRAQLDNHDGQNPQVQEMPVDIAEAQQMRYQESQAENFAHQNGMMGNGIQAAAMESMGGMQGPQRFIGGPNIQGPNGYQSMQNPNGMNSFNGPQGLRSSNSYQDNFNQGNFNQVNPSQGGYQSMQNGNPYQRFNNPNPNGQFQNYAGAQGNQQGIQNLSAGNSPIQGPVGYGQMADQRYPIQYGALNARRY